MWERSAMLQGKVTSSLPLALLPGFFAWLASKKPSTFPTPEPDLTCTLLERMAAHHSSYPPHVATTDGTRQQMCSDRPCSVRTPRLTPSQDPLSRHAWRKHLCCRSQKPPCPRTHGGDPSRQPR